MQKHERKMVLCSKYCSYFLSCTARHQYLSLQWLSSSVWICTMYITFWHVLYFLSICIPMIHALSLHGAITLSYRIFSMPVFSSCNFPPTHWHIRLLILGYQPFVTSFSLDYTLCSVFIPSPVSPPTFSFLLVSLSLRYLPSRPWQPQKPVLRIHRIHMFLGLLDPDPDPLVRGMDPDPDPSIIKQNYQEKH